MAAFRVDHMVLDLAAHESLLAVATQSGRVSLLDWKRGKELPPALQPGSQGEEALPPAALSVALSPSGRSCASVTADGRLRMHELDPEGRARLRWEEERESLAVARFAGEGRLLLGNLRGEIALFDLTARQDLYRSQLEYDPVSVIALDPSGARAAVGFDSSRIALVEVATGRLLARLAGHRDAVYGLAWLGTERLASASKDKSLLLWDLRNAGAAAAEPRRLWAGDLPLTALAADASGEWLALPVAANAVGVLRTADGREEQRLHGHSAPVRALAFLPGSGGQRFLASAGGDAQVLVWRLGSEGAHEP